MSAPTATARTRRAPWGGPMPVRGRLGGPGFGERFLTRDPVTRLSLAGLPRPRKGRTGGPLFGNRARDYRRRVSRLALWGGHTRRKGGLGGVAFGMLDTTLVLSRTDRSTGASLENADGWTVEPNGARDTFNGAGQVQLATNQLRLQPGFGVTLAVRFWIGGGQVQGAPAGPVAKTQQLLGLTGFTMPGSEAGVGVVVTNPTAGTPDLTVRRYNGGSPVETVIASAAVPAEAFVLVATFAGEAGGVRVRAFIDGALAGELGSLIDADEFDLDAIVFGDAVESDGSFSAAAAWSRVLSDDEIASIGSDLHALRNLPPIADGGDGSNNPLIGSCGAAVIHPEWIVPRTDRVDAAEASAGRRHARTVNDRRPRTYELRWSLIDDRELSLIRQAIALTRAGAAWTRWRHPQDDPGGPVSLSPRWRIANAGEAELQINRIAGGARAALTLVLEELA